MKVAHLLAKYIFNMCSFKVFIFCYACALLVHLSFTFVTCFYSVLVLLEPETNQSQIHKVAHKADFDPD